MLVKHSAVVKCITDSTLSKKDVDVSQIGSWCYSEEEAGPQPSHIPGPACATGCPWLHCRVPLTALPQPGGDAAFSPATSSSVSPDRIKSLHVQQNHIGWTPNLLKFNSLCSLQEENDNFSGIGGERDSSLADTQDSSSFFTVHRTLDFYIHTIMHWVECTRPYVLRGSRTRPVEPSPELDVPVFKFWFHHLVALWPWASIT